VAPFWHGALAQTSLAQLAPKNPLAHAQEYGSTESSLASFVQVPEFSQGPEAQGSCSIWQRGPEKPEAHMQLHSGAFTSMSCPSMFRGGPTETMLTSHVPCWLQGLLAQMLSSQLSPLKTPVQMHRKVESPHMLM
jgi:hypothetical protein